MNGQYLLLSVYITGPWSANLKQPLKFDFSTYGRYVRYRFLPADCRADFCFNLVDEPKLRTIQLITHQRVGVFLGPVRHNVFWFSTF